MFFDVGFTLLTPHPSTLEIVRATCAAHDLPVDEDALRQRAPQAETYFRRMARERPWAWRADESINALWACYYAELLGPCLPAAAPERLATCIAAIQRAFDAPGSYRLFPDVLPVLAMLRERGLVMGAISDWGMSLAPILRHHDLVRYFDFAIISAAVRHAKPDPALYEQALRRANTIADYALHIGDSYVQDVLGARAVGITPVLLDRRGLLDPAALDCPVTRDLYGVLALLELPRPAARVTLE